MTCPTNVLRNINFTGQFFASSWNNSNIFLIDFGDNDKRNISLGNTYKEIPKMYYSVLKYNITVIFLLTGDIFYSTINGN